MTSLASAHDELRPLMFSIAYRMLGSVTEAEDVVQEAFLRMHRSSLEGGEVDSPEAFATTVTTRLAIDTLRSARVRREQYVGPWLPEPLVRASYDDADADDPAHRVTMDETVSSAFLVLLETLSPVERAVFVLREVLAYDYADIARIVGKSEANCRQILTRARRHVDERRPRYEPSAARRDELARRFVAALGAGDVAEVESMLADDVVFVGDGGGRAPAIRKPMVGATQVARFVLGMMRQVDILGILIDVVESGGQPAVRVRARGGELLGVMTIGIRDGRVRELHNVINPDKLRHLGPVGDLTAVLQDRGPAVT